MKIALAIYPEFIGKGDFKSPNANTSFENKEISVQDLAHSIDLGMAFSAQFHSSKRLNSHFNQSGWVALDFDHGMTLTEALADPFIQNYACIIYTTVNHHKEKQRPNGTTEPPCDRFRVIFKLENPITSIEEYRAVYQGLFKKYPKADRSTGDPARLFCGSQGCQPLVFEGRFLPQAVVQELVHAGQIERMEIGHTPWELGSISSDEARKMLSHIPINRGGNVILGELIGHAAWIRVVFSIASAFDSETAFSLIQEWSPDDKGGSYIRTLLHNANGEISMGTLIFHAVRNGYRLAPDLERKQYEKGRTSGQVLLEDVLAGGEDFITIKGTLHHYDGQGLYLAINQDALLADTLKYFNTYKTAKGGKTAFATAKTAENAIDFAIGICKPSAKTVINPPGLNFFNGILRLFYDYQGNPQFELIPHSPELVFNYRANCEWQGDPSKIDFTYFDTCFKRILPKRAEQEIFLRTIAAALDLQHVRARLKNGRTIKALILEGEGANGKDTLRIWTKELFGAHAMASVSIRTFKDGDAGHLFGMVPLAHSKINWPSENGRALLDEAESLKAFLTGDSGVRAAYKYKDEFLIEPTAVSIFSMNKLPAAKAAIEAIRSRFSVIRLSSVFTHTPDPNNPRHHQIDVRYKEDLEFIHQNILPAFAYRVIEAYQKLLQEGIDYSVTEHHLEDIRKESNHIHQFMEDQNLVLCTATEGMSPQQLYNDLYVPWAIGEGYIYTDASNGYRYNNPHDPFDTIVKHPNGLLQRLRSAHPSIDYKRSGKKRKIGLKCIDVPLYPCGSTGIEASMK